MSEPFVVRRPSKPILGTYRLPGDKSIAHRAILLAAEADGVSTLHNVPQGEDVLSTIRVVGQLGVRTEWNGTTLRVHGVGFPDGLIPPKESLDCGNSGTTARILMGMLAGRSFGCEIVGDASLSRRPMERVASPLRQLGAKIDLTDGHLPARLAPSQLEGATVKLFEPSAQVQAALMWAGLRTRGTTTVTALRTMRNHTHVLFSSQGVCRRPADDVDEGGDWQSTEIVLPESLTPLQLEIPGDSSSAAYLIAAALLVPGSELTLTNLSLNESRLGWLKSLAAETESIQISPHAESGNEPSGIITVTHANMKRLPYLGNTLQAPWARSSFIDEIPILAILASQAKGVSFAAGVEELRIKESDRLAGLIKNLKAMQGSALAVKGELYDHLHYLRGTHAANLLPGLPRENAEHLIILGPTRLSGARIDPQGDHRIAMAFAIAGLVADGETIIEDPDCVNISFPGFWDILSSWLS